MFKERSLTGFVIVPTASCNASPFDMWHIIFADRIDRLPLTTEIHPPAHIRFAIVY